MRAIFETLCGCSQVLHISKEAYDAEYYKLPLIDPDESARLIRMNNKNALKETINTRLFKRVGEKRFREVANQ